MSFKKNLHKYIVIVFPILVTFTSFPMKKGNFTRNNFFQRSFAAAFSKHKKILPLKNPFFRSNNSSKAPISYTRIMSFLQNKFHTSSTNSYAKMPLVIGTGIALYSTQQSVVAQEKEKQKKYEIDHVDLIKELEIQASLYFAGFYHDAKNRIKILSNIEYDSEGKLTDILIKNIATVFEYDNALELFEKILKKHPDKKETINDATIVNFIELAKTEVGTTFLEQIVLDNDANKKKFSEEFLNKNHYGQHGLKFIKEHKKLASFIKHEIIEKDSSAIMKKLNDKSIFSISVAYQIEPLLKLIFDLNPKNISLIAHNLIDKKSLEKLTPFVQLLSHYSITKKLLTIKFITNALSMKLTDFAFYYFHLIDTVENKQTIKNLLNNTGELLDITIILKKIFYSVLNPDEKDLLQQLPNTPTVNHLYQFFKKNSLKQLNTLAYRDWKPILNNAQELSSILKKIIAKEIELKSEYYTFIHGQRNHYLIPETIFTILKDHKKPRNFLYMHLRTPHETSKENKKREQLLRNGRPIFDFYNDRQFLLFLNRAFFGNLTNLGSCSAYYALNNNNAKSIPAEFKTIFGITGHSDLYPKYEKRLTELQEKFTQLTNYGTILLIAVPKTTAHKQLFLAHPGGYKKRIPSSVDIHESFFELDETTIFPRISTTDNIHKLMKDLEENPHKIEDSDQLEFCIPMTFDKYGGLNPESGIKIFSFNIFNKQKKRSFISSLFYSEDYKLLQKELDDLYKQLVDDINKKNHQ